MQDDAFARLVAEEVKNRVTGPQADYLRLPENWTRWQRALVALVENLNRQVAEINAREVADATRYEALGEAGTRLLAESLAESEDKRKKIERFRFHVENRLDEVTRMIAVGSQQVDERLKTVGFLQAAIERHHALIAKFNIEPTKIDEALWAAVDGQWLFDDITEDDIPS